MNTNTKRHLILDLSLFGFACLAVLILLLTRGGLYAGGPQGHPSPHPTSTLVGRDHRAGPSLQEDDPGWNCHTMGNKSCGSPACAFLRGSSPEMLYIRRTCNNNIDAGAHWHPFRGAYDGHHGCLILVGPTSLFRCGGWVISS